MRKILNIPNVLTLLRIIVIPLMILAYYLPVSWSHIAATGLFVLASVTDWLDGYLARRLNQHSPFGAFLDPVADKLVVAAALVLVVADVHNHELSLNSMLFTIMVLVIIGREITVSALREWMAEMGVRSKVAVSWVGKLKTAAQMLSVPFLLYRENIGSFHTFKVGELLLYCAAFLTIWSMLSYLKAAWPVMKGQDGGR
jgi:CDP-diacylglycerol--glycerol-3-phosphate 3-phosphatidyltransferase